MPARPCVGRRRALREIAERPRPDVASDCCRWSSGCRRGSRRCRACTRVPPARRSRSRPWRRRSRPSCCRRGRTRGRRRRRGSASAIAIFTAAPHRKPVQSTTTSRPVGEISPVSRLERFILRPTRAAHGRVCVTQGDVRRSDAPRWRSVGDRPAPKPLLLRRAVDDPAAFDELYDELAQRVLLFFTRRVFDGQLALDLTGETFATAVPAAAQLPRHHARGAGGLDLRDRAQPARRATGGAGRVERAALERIGVEVPVVGDAELERVSTSSPAPRSVRARVAHELEPPARPTSARRSSAHVVEERLLRRARRDEWGVSEQTIRARVSRGLREPRCDT